jgi:hypothetical protein
MGKRTDEQTARYTCKMSPPFTIVINTAQFESYGANIYMAQPLQRNSGLLQEPFPLQNMKHERAGQKRERQIQRNRHERIVMKVNSESLSS